MFNAGLVAQHKTPSSNSSECSLFAKTLLFPIAFASASNSSVQLFMAATKSSEEAEEVDEEAVGHGK